MRNYYLFKNFTSSADAGATITLPQGGTIKHIQLVTKADLDADGETYAVELSLVPTFQAHTNDAQGILAVAASQNTSTATAVASTTSNVPCNARVNAGDKLYLNGLLTGVNDVSVYAIVSVQ